MASTASVSEEKPEPGDVSVADVTKKDEQHEKLGEVEKSLQESEVSNSSEPAVETYEGSLQRQADDAHEIPGEVQEKSSDFVVTSTSQEPVISESKTEDWKDTEIKPTSEIKRKQDEPPLVYAGVYISDDENVEVETLEAANPESSKDKADIEFIKSEDLKDEIQVLVPAKISTIIVPDAFEVPEKCNIDLGNPAKVPVKVLKVESGSPEEQKPKVNAESKEPSSNASTIDAGVEIVGFSSYEVKPSEAEVETKLAYTESDEIVSQGIEVKKDDEIVEGCLEASTVPDVPPLAKVSFEEEKASEPGVLVEEKVTSLESGNVDAVPKVVEVSLEAGNVWDVDKLVGKEKVVNVEAVERDLVDTITHPTKTEVSSVQVKAHTTTEIVNDALEVKSKELNTAPETVEVFSEGDKISVGDEKSESLKVIEATSVEAPTYITAAEEPLDQVIEEKKIEISVSSTQVPYDDKLVDKEKCINEEAKEINLQNQADDTHEATSIVQNDFVEKSALQEPAFSESKIEDLNYTEIRPTSENERKQEEVPLVSNGVDISKDGNFEAVTQEAANPGFSEDKVDIELIKLEDSKDEIQVFVPIETPTAIVLDSSEAPEKIDIDSSNLTSIEVPVKDLEVESGSPEEQKANGNTKTKELSSNGSAIDAGGEAVVGSSSYEAKPSGVAEMIEKKNDSLELETIHTSVEIHEDIEAKPELAQTQSDENVSEGVKVKNDDEIVEPDIEISIVLDDIPPLVKVSYDDEKASEPSVVVGEEASLEGNNIDAVPKVSEVSFEGGNVLEGDKLVDMEKCVNAEAVEGDFFDTITDPTEAEVSSIQVKASTTTEIVNEAQEVTSNKLIFAPEASVVFYEGDISASDEKTESLKGEQATSVEEPIDITIAEGKLGQVIEEKKIESSVRETQVPSEDKLVDKEKYVNEEAKEINLQSQAYCAHEPPSVVQSDFAEKSTAQDPEFSESKIEDLKDTEIKPTSDNDKKPEEAPLFSIGVGSSKDENVEVETQEASNPGFSEDKVDIKLIKLKDSKDEVQVFAPTETPTPVLPDASEAPEKIDIDSSNLTCIEVPVKGLEVESGSPEEQKLNESTETKEPSSNGNAINAGGEIVVGSSSYEAKPLGVAEMIEKNNDCLEVETMQTSVKIQENLEAKLEFVQTQTDEYVSEGVKVKMDDEIVEGGIEISTVPDDIPPLAKISYEEENASEPGIVAEEDTSLEGDNIDTMPKVVEVSFEGENVLERDKLVDKEEVVNVESVERDFVDTITNPVEAEVTCVQVKSPTTTVIVNDALEVTCKELNIDSEASEVPSDGDKLSAGDEKIESLKVEVATSVEAPKDITITEESFDQVIEEKSESLVSKTQASSQDKLADKEKDVNEEANEINLQSQVDGADETLSVVQSDFSKTSTSQEPVYSESKNKVLKDTEIKATSVNGRKQEEALLVSNSVDIFEDGNMVAEKQEATNLQSSKDNVDIELMKSEDSKDEIQVLVHDDIPTVVVPDASESPQRNDVDSRNLTTIEAPVKNLEVEFGSPKEQKSKHSTKTKEPSSNVSTIDVGGEVAGSSSYEIRSSGVADLVEKKDDGLEVETIQTSVKIQGYLEAKPELAQAESDENVSQGVEVKKDDVIAEGCIDTSTVPVDVSLLAEVSSEDEKASESNVVVEEEETSLKSDNIDTISKVNEVSLEGGNVLEGDKLVDNEKVVNAEPEVVERDLIDTFIDPTIAEVSSDQVKAPTITEIVNEALEVTSKELNIVPEDSELPGEVDKVFVGDEEKSESLIVVEATSVEAPNDIITIKEALDQLFEEKKSESEMAGPTEDKLVDKEKNVNVEDEGRDLINTSTYAIAAEVSSEQVKALEIVEEETYQHALDETSKELNIAPEACEVPSEDDKRETLRGEAATLVEEPKDITTIEESLDQVIEKKKNESSISEKEYLPEDKLVDTEKNVKEEAERRDLVDTSTDPTATEVSSDQLKASEAAEIIEESNKQASEVTSKELNIASEASDVPSEGDEVPAVDEEKRESLKVEDATLVDAPKYITIAEESPDQLIIQKKSEGSKSEMESLAKDKLVDKEKYENAEAERTDLVDTSTDLSASVVYSELVKVTENADTVNESDKKALELTFKELNIVPEAGEVPLEGEKAYSGEAEKSESLKCEDVTSLEAAKDITYVEESIDQLIEENKSESSKNETEAPIETTRDFDTSKLFPEAVNDIIASEAADEKQDETSNDHTPAEKKANESEDKEEEVKVEGVLQNATDKFEQEELGAVKKESEKSKDQNPIVSSDSGDAKLTKEVIKRESNIFSKVKRSIVKAKKAILGKSPGPKTLSSDAKD